MKKRKVQSKRKKYIVTVLRDQFEFNTMPAMLKRVAKALRAGNYQVIVNCWPIIYMEKVKKK